MDTNMTMGGKPLWRAMRWAVWGGAALVLLLPLVAMRFPGTGVDWTGSDFAAMASLLLLPCLAFEAAVRVGRSHAFVLACGIAAAAAFVLTWANLAVGIIGDEDNPANLLFFAVPVVAVLGAAWSRLQAQRLARAMEFTAVVQGLACLVALALDGLHVFALTSGFVAMWVLSAQLFRRAARAERRVG